MKWSKLKQNIENMFSPAVKNRVKIYATHYKNNDQMGRVWFTLDSREIVNLCDWQASYKHGYFYHETTPDIPYATHEKVDEKDRTEGKLVEYGEFSRFDANICMFKYIQISIDEALNHDSPIIQAIAVLDKRTGKKRVKAKHDVSTHPLIKEFCNIRLQLEKEFKQNK